jgi:hypothetical protein
VRPLCLAISTDMGGGGKHCRVDSGRVEEGESKVGARVECSGIICVHRKGKT